MKKIICKMNKPGFIEGLIFIAMCLFFLSIVPIHILQYEYYSENPVSFKILSVGCDVLLIITTWKIPNIMGFFYETYDDREI